MSINFPNADFTPQLAGYTGQGAFRFWCQKVLPIVYDDSLSYYELLNKVVNYLNNVIADVATVEGNVAELNDSYVQLQEYVNTHMSEIVEVVNTFTEFIENYFDNLDVQEEINNKLDVMASDGSLSEILRPFIALEAPDIISAWLDEHITPTTPIIDDTLSISGAAADAKVTGDKISSLDYSFGSRNITKYLTSVNNNYLFRDELNESGYFNPRTGEKMSSTNYRRGLVAYPCSGNYKILQKQSRFTNNYLYIPLFYGDGTFYKSILGTSNDGKIVSFTITEEDAGFAPFIGVSMNTTDEYPMLILNADYPASQTFSQPMINLPLTGCLRYMGACPKETELLIQVGWYRSVGSGSGWTGLPNNFSGSAGSLIVLPNAVNNTYGIHVLFSGSQNKVWARYVRNDGTGALPWFEFATTDIVSSLTKLPYNNTRRISFNNVSLSGNYFDYEKADWIVGYDTGYTINDTSGYFHAFAKLPGPGQYVRIMRNGSFGVSCTRIALYDANKNYVKTKTATRVDDTDGYSFEITEEDLVGCMYTTLNYQVGREYNAALYYNTEQFPIPVGNVAPRPNYNPVSDPVYKAIFICDGDSICAGAHDQPEARTGWWGRFRLDYSTAGRNYGVNGGTITANTYFQGGKARHWLSRSIDTIYSTYPELDYLILEGGTNDADVIGGFSGDAPPALFGTWSETDFSGSYDDTTFCGAVETLFYKALMYYPHAKIGFIVAMEMGTNNATVANRRRYFDEIIKIANKWHIPVLDLWRESQMDARLVCYYDSSLSGSQNVQQGKCYYDGQHPTSYGYNLIQNKIDSWVHSL